MALLRLQGLAQGLGARTLYRMCEASSRRVTPMPACCRHHSRGPPGAAPVTTSCTTCHDSPLSVEMRSVTCTCGSAADAGVTLARPGAGCGPARAVPGVSKGWLRQVRAPEWN